jgi:arabinan endo-1,5-alpha-L-arabinosidase
MLRAIGGCLALLACSGAPDVVARTHDDYDPTRPPHVLTLSGDILAHDPSIIETDGRVFLFYTASGIGTKTSDDLVNYREGPSVFSERPSWIAERVPDVGDLWSPDISYFDGSYHLYYAASTFGSDRSCIGLATSPSLGAAALWQDRGAVICSNVNGSVDDFNAIDPELVLDQAGKPHLAFGSFNSGLELVALDDSGLHTVGTPVSIAARPENDNAVQAASIWKRGAYYYLFSSFDLCCAGANSTHRLMVGRSSALNGPYVDRNGVALLEGGGTLVLESGERWRGPGSNTIFYRDGRAYNVYHAYDADDDGKAKLRIAELTWDPMGWPLSGGP